MDPIHFARQIYAGDDLRIIFRIADREQFIANLAHYRVALRWIDAAIFFAALHVDVKTIQPMP